MNKKILYILLCFLVGCSSSNSNSKHCDDPVDIEGDAVGANGYIVGIEETSDVNIVAVEYLEKYDDLEIYAILALSNSFVGNSDAKTLERLQCETSVLSIHYNEVTGSN